MQAHLYSNSGLPIATSYKKLTRASRKMAIIAVRVRERISRGEIFNHMLMLNAINKDRDR